MFTSNSFKKINYVIKYPKDYSPEKKYPTIILMHGAGGRGNDLEKTRTNPFFTITQGHEDFPFVVFAPQCCADTWFDLFETVNDFAKYVSELPYVDEDRLYLIGASMGGYAVWQMAMSNPSLYAAIIPICGGGMYWNTARLKKVPVWAFHGDIDNSVKCQESVNMVNATNANGGNAKLTVYENCGHNAWTPTYSNLDVFKWLLSNTKSKESHGRTEFNDSEIYG